MDCEKCGAEVLEGADKCPECGEPIGAPDQASVETPDAAVDTIEPAEDSEFGTDGGPETDTASEPEEAEETPSKKRWIVVAIALGIIAVLLVGGYFAYTAGLLGFLTGNDPGSAATRMLKAFANYDAQGILDNSTHTSMQADAIKAFTQQAADAKKNANGKPGVKDIKVVSVTIDSKDPNKATVEISGSWLDSSGAYKAQTEKLQMVKENGKWLVKLLV